MELRVRFASIFLLICSLAHVGLAQTITAALTGTVTDTSGAVVPNVKVTATNTSTNVATETTTNNEGIFNLPFLPIGSYTVAAEGAGFKRTVVGPFTLEVNQTARGLFAAGRTVDRNH
ncbi:MAG TPA: carboxypeptidase-like regulatory domain-containing protein [Bryobacteraceae bacterium]|nr:carboxypeptidase-like regulatory domain-containing protein [Bryobacteraceae bacterium]